MSKHVQFTEKNENKLIADFMHLTNYKGLDDLKFNISWDWLMPVVEKCHEITDKKQRQFPESKDLDDPTGWRAWSYRRIELSTDIGLVFNDVVEFIKWYNQQSKP